jgi:proteasome-associated ATPase
MPRTPHPGSELPILDELLTFGDDAQGLDGKVELVRALRSAASDGGRRLDRALLDRLARTAEGRRAAEAAQAELRGLLNALDSPPWHPALFLRAVPTALGARAMVLDGGARRVVAVAKDVDLDALQGGEEVFLGKDHDVVAGRSPWGTPRVGETAAFERTTGDGRCVLRWRDEEVVVDVAATLDASALASGDLVRFDRGAWMALEKLDGREPRFLIGDVPDVSRAAVGGQEKNLDLLLSALGATLVAPDTAALYGLGGRQSILLVGPPGCGKTLMARVAAAEIHRLSGRRCRFAVVKPAEWESPWVGETQRNIRHCFQALRATNGDAAVLFLDEIESVGRIRGAVANQHADKFLAALLAELDGFEGRADVAIVAATNRKDLVDPALLERLSDVEIAVGRPDMRAARAIFDIHLPATAAAAGARDEIVETAVSLLYGPNAENALCTLRFRDGRARTLVARELASGRVFAQVCRAACRRAFLRHLRGEPGLRVADMAEAVGEAIARLASTLGRHNVHAHLSDLPQDVDVVSVEPVTRRVSCPHRYRHAA